MPLHKYKIDDVFDCWYLDEASTLALRGDIEAGDKRDWNCQAQKTARVACTHYAIYFSSTNETNQFGLSESTSYMNSLP
jgi:hypothetical protein